MSNGHLKCNLFRCNTFQWSKDTKMFYLLRLLKLRISWSKSRWLVVSWDPLVDTNGMLMHKTRPSSSTDDKDDQYNCSWNSCRRLSWLNLQSNIVTGEEKLYHIHSVARAQVTHKNILHVSKMTTIFLFSSHTDESTLCRWMKFFFLC